MNRIFVVKQPSVSDKVLIAQPAGTQGPKGDQGEPGPAAEWSNLTGLIDIAPFDTSNGGPTATGELAWMAATETLALRLKNGENLDLGEETIYHVDNNTGSTIAKGAAVAYAGTVGASGKIRVKLWNGSTDAPEAFMGLAMGDIPTGDDGYVTAFGVIRGVNTSAFTDGVILYASPSGTGLTATKPAGVHVIACLCINAGNNGTLLVRPTVSGFSADNHTHGNITNAGAIGTTADLVAVTGTGGALTVASRSGIDSRTTFPNADVTAATNFATANTLVRRDANGGAQFSGGAANSALVAEAAIGSAIFAESLSGIGISVASVSGTGLFASSVSGTGLFASSQSGTNHAEFGESANNRSFIRRVLGLIGWHRGSFTQTFGSGATLTANRAVTLPDADGEATLNAATQTLTNKTLDAPTITGAAAFTSTTRPTSSGTGTPASDSLITRADGDARYGDQIVSYLTSDGVTVNNTTTLADSGLELILPIGNYMVEGYVFFRNATNAAGGRVALAVISGTATSPRGVFSAPATVTPTGYTSGAGIITEKSTTSPIAFEGIVFIKGVMQVTADVVVRVRFAQGVAQATNSTVNPGSWISATRIP